MKFGEMKPPMQMLCYNRVRTKAYCIPLTYLFFFGVQLKALIQGTAMLLKVLLLLVPHALCIFHYFLLDAAK